MSQDEKLQDILDSYYNGQKSQMVSQIRDYGVKEFFSNDLLDYLKEYGYPTPLAKFQNIVKIYFLLVDAGTLTDPSY